MNSLPLLLCKVKVLKAQNINILCKDRLWTHVSISHQRPEGEEGRANDGAITTMPVVTIL